MVKKLDLTIVRNKFGKLYCRVSVDVSTTTNPDLSVEIADLFKQVDESGEVNNFAYTDNKPVSAYKGDFAENETTYQGAYEEYLYGNSEMQQESNAERSEAKRSGTNEANAELPNDSSAPK